MLRCNRVGGMMNGNRMRIATWNVNHRVGRTTFRPEAAHAACALDADLICLNEFYPKSEEESFRRVLFESGYCHQLISPAAPSGVQANRVLIASRKPMEQVDLQVPTHEPHLRTNVLGVRTDELTIVGMRVPAYDGLEAAHLLAAWEWASDLAARLCEQPAVILGDLNVSLKSLGYQKGRHLQAILASGWTRVATVGATYHGHNGVRSEIDHVLVTRQCRATHPVVLTTVGEFSLCGQANSISDHAVLMCDLESVAMLSSPEVSE